jgi:acylglycerol lipase
VFGDSVVDGEVATNDPTAQVRDRGQRRHVGESERPALVVPVTRHDDPALGIDQVRQRGRRGRPIHRVAIVEERDRPALEQIAGPHDPGSGHRDHGVVVGVAATQEAKLDGAPADLDRGRVVERAIWWVDDHLGEVGGDLGLLRRDPGQSPLGGPCHERDAARLAPDGCGPEHVIPQDVIEVSMRIHDDRHRIPRQLPEIGGDLASLDMRRSRVDDERLAAPQDDPDVLVVERIAAHEESIVELDPAVSDTHARHGSDTDASANPYAHAVPSIVGSASTRDGIALLTRHWPADEAAAGGAWAGVAWGSVLLVHGLGEHSGRYDHVGELLAAAGLDVDAYDQRGMGGSEGRRGHVDRWSQMHDDLEDRLALVRRESRSRPVAMYGHSLGGLLVAGYCRTPRPKPDLVVLSAPALDDGLPAWKKALAPILGRVAPTVSVPNDIKVEWRSRDPGVGQQADADPDCVKASTTRFGAEALREQARVRGAVAPDGLGLPTLVIHGADDELVPASASAVFEGLPMTTRRVFPGLRHETHNEPEGPDVIDAIVTWLRQQVAGTARPTVVG